MGLPRDQIKAEASARIEQVLAALGIDAEMRGKNSIAICNPIRAEKNPSLQIWLKAGYEGAWKDHGINLRGDIFDLVAYFNGWDGERDRGFAKAADWLTATLGLGGRIPDKDLRALRAKQERRAQDASRESEKNRGRALAIFLKGQPIIDTPVDRYLLGRGIDVRRLARMPRAIRYLPDHPHRESGMSFPCMVALMQDAAGKPAAIHRTWLRRDGSGKADVTPARKIWPNFAGAFIAIARGCSGLSAKEASAAGIADILVPTEGVEDGLSVAVADGEPRVWAVGSLSNLGNIALPACVHSVVMPVDNDWGKPEAQAMLQRALKHLGSFGVPVAPVRSPIGKDVNDLMRGAV